MASTAIARTRWLQWSSTGGEGRRKPTKTPSMIAIRWRRRAFAIVSVQGEDAANGGDNNIGALESNTVFDDLLPEIASKDKPSLPKPLSVSDISGSVNGSRLRVAYQGLSGAYSEAAAAKAYPNWEAVPCELFETAFDVLERSLVDRAVLPFENSLGGSIHCNYVLLLHHKMHIVGEVKYAARHCLLANPGVKKEDLKRVLSHPQALAQCEHTLTKLGVVREAVDDTAGAAKDDPDNVTWFLMLSREPIIPGIDKPFKTSIVFSLEEGPGVLFKALAVFAMRDINLTKIESRPRKKKPLRVAEDGTNGHLKYFDYLFYVDFETSMAEPNAQNALRHLKEFATF